MEKNNMQNNTSYRKIGVIGCGNVGVSFTYFALASSLANEFILIDVFEELRDGQVLDLQDAVFPATYDPVVRAGGYEDLKDANLIFISAGRPQKPGETRLEMLQDNKSIMEDIAKKVRDSGFQGVVLIASNPVDILTYVFYKASGFARNRVIGSGTVLDTSRLRYMIAQDCGVSTKSVEAYVLGEHGDSSLVAYSQIKVAGVPYLELKDTLTTTRDCCTVPQPKYLPENYEEKLEYVVSRRAYQIINRKRATYYGIGACITRLASAVLNNSLEILPAGPVLDGEYGYKNIVFGTPCVLGKDGIHKVVELQLNAKEKEKLKNSTDVIYKNLATVQL